MSKRYVQKRCMQIRLLYQANSKRHFLVFFQQVVDKISARNVRGCEVSHGYRAISELMTND